MSRLTDIRDIAVETAAVAMGRTDLDGTTLGMRQRRALAEAAYQAIVPILAREVRAEGDQLADRATTPTDYAHAEGLRGAAVIALSTLTPAA